MGDLLVTQPLITQSQSH